MVISIKKKVIVNALILFFLNRVFSFEFLTTSEIINELFVIISEIITIYEIIKFFYLRTGERAVSIRKDAVFGVICVYFVYLLADSILQESNIRRIFMSAYPIILHLL